MMNKKEYISPTIEVKRFILDDVILASVPIEIYVPTEYHDIENPTEIDLDDLG